jgi:hypothetical protein
MMMLIRQNHAWTLSSFKKSILLIFYDDARADCLVMASPDIREEVVKLNKTLTRSDGKFVIKHIMDLVLAFCGICHECVTVTLIVVCPEASAPHKC